MSLWFLIQKRIPRHNGAKKTENKVMIEKNKNEIAIKDQSSIVDDYEWVFKNILVNDQWPIIIC